MINTVSIADFVKVGTNRTGVWGKLYRASVAKKCKFPEGHYGEDIYYNAIYLTDNSVITAGVVESVTYLRYDNASSASHLWDVKDFLDIAEVIEKLYLVVKQRANNRKIREQYLQLFFTQFCKCKYNIILRRGYTKDIKALLKRVRKRHIKELFLSHLGIKYKLVLLIFSASNWVYRTWLLHDDPSMKLYEKAF